MTKFYLLLVFSLLMLGDAKAASSKDYYLAARKSIKARQYQKAIALLKRVKEKQFEKKKLQLLGLSYLELEKHDEAAAIYDRLILRYQKKDNQQITYYLKKRRPFPPTLKKNKEISYYYLQKARAFTRKFITLDPEAPELTPVLKKAKLHLVVVKNLGAHAEQVSSLSEELQFKREEIEDARKARLEEKKQMEYHWNTYFELGYLSWIDTITANFDTGNTTKILGAVQSYHLGLGLKYENIRYEYILRANILTGLVDYTQAAGELNFRVGSVGIFGLMASGGVFWKPVSDKIAIGISIPVLFRSSSPSTEDTPIVDFDRSSIITTGLEFEGRWYFGSHMSYGLAVRVGKLLGMEGAIWGFSGQYHF